ncbi:MAG: M20 family metallo-hydrolase [Prevotella sp.]|nr:M20 family metallo-hydrolase [Prevotella sp.]
MTTIDTLTNDAVTLLKELIATPSVSRDEEKAADIMQKAMEGYGFSPIREGNNLWIIDTDMRPDRPTLLLNAHIDTVKPVASWTRDPFSPTIEGDTLYGLGSNDCGGGLVSLLQVFRYMQDKPRNYNLVYLASAEEEVSGVNGIRRVIDLLPHIDVAMVGEPTGMQPAVAEKGLMVIDMTAHGKSGHAARGEGINAIYEALDDMRWIRDYRFEKVSEFLGPTVMNLTVVNSGTQHNVIPDECKMIVDVRSNENYDNEEIFHFIDKNTKSDCKARSYHLRSSRISLDHSLIQKLTAMGKVPFGSPTLSDQALMPWESFKLGPGQSSRSHSADEFICISEIRDAIETYIELLNIEK